MKHMKNAKQKGSTNKMLLAIVVMVLVVAGIYYFKQPMATVSNDTELMQASQQLDAVDVDTSIDGGLGQNENDMATFK